MHSRFAAILSMASVFLLPIAAAQAQAPNHGQALITKVAPAIVTVRVVIKIQVKAGGQSRSQESKVATEGVIVTPDGLIMMSNAPISSTTLRQMLGGGDDDSNAVSISPTDFKVTISNEEKEYTAFLAATDAKLGLAFIKIQDLAGRKLPTIDFSNCPAVNIGDQVAAVTRLGKGYDYAPIYAEGPVKGAITKPRPAFLLSTAIISVGLPVFTLDGQPLGMIVFLPAGVSADSSGSMDIMMRYYSGAAADRLGIFLVPGAVVNPIIGEAIDQAVKVAADRAKNPPPAPTPTPAPAPTAPTPAPATPAPKAPAGK